MKVELYGNTGFDSVNIPDSPQMVRQYFTPKKVVEDCPINQTNDQANIIVEIESNLAKTIDYVIIEKNQDDISCYTVEHRNETSPDIVVFYLLQDSHGCIGGFGLDSGNLIVSGSANRLTVPITEDETKFFTLDEPFQPSERFDVVFDRLGNPQLQNTIIFAETITIPPQTIESVIEPENFGWETSVKKNTWTGVLGVNIGESIAQYKKDTDAGKVETLIINREIKPVMRPLKSTEVVLTDIDGSQKTILTQTRYWVMSPGFTDYEINLDGKTIKGNLIKDFRDNGRDNDIINCWEMPVEFFEYTDSFKYEPKTENAGPGSNFGGVGKYYNKIINRNITIQSNYFPYNNKVKYSQSHEIKIFNPVINSQMNKRIYEIVNSGSQPNQQTFVSNFIITADPRPQGCPIFLFEYINGISQRMYSAEVLTGGNWRNIPLCATGLSNMNYEKARLEQEKRIQEKNSIGSILGGLGQIALGGLMVAGSGAGAVATGGASAPVSAGGMTAGGSMILSGGGTILGGITSFIGASQRQQEQQELLNRQSISASSQLLGGNNDFSRDCGNNRFYMMKTSYSQNDLFAYDCFLTKFGYNVGNRPISNADFFSRPAFNYVRLNDITIKSEKYSLNLIENVKTQLKAGVRIWHRPVNVDDMSAGGNRQ